MTARNRIMILSNVKYWGLKMPFLATSIIPLEKKEPARIPNVAIINIVLTEATLEPKAEFKKFTASLLTPTIKSNAASTKSSITIKRNRLMPTSFLIPTKGHQRYH
jgi:hypothetical protein